MLLAGIGGDGRAAADDNDDDGDEIFVLPLVLVM
jgi:hypothetical protein